MHHLRHFAFTLFLALVAFTLPAHAQGSLSAIRDIVLLPGGTPFNGTITLNWSGFTTADGTVYPPHSTITRVTNGQLLLLLPPTTTATTPKAQYTATYLTSDGQTTWTETWGVPPSVTPLTVAQIRIPNGSNPGGGSTGGSGTGSGSGSSGSSGTITLPIQISDVANLGSTLNGLRTQVTSLNGTVGNLSLTLAGVSSTANGLSSSVSALSNNVSALGATVTSNSGALQSVTATVNTLSSAVAAAPQKSATYLPSTLAMIDASGKLTSVAGAASNCVHVDGSSGPCSSAGATAGSIAAYVDGEVPAGTLDGINSRFTLSQTPTPSLSLELYRNGVLQRSTIDYTLSSGIVQFLSGAIPQPNDLLQAFYRVPGTGPLTTPVDAELPAGNIDGVNQTFTLAAAPSPTASLRLYRNGLLLRSGLDYTLANATITFNSASTPSAQDSLVAYYRH